MRFAELVETYERLEATSKRLEMRTVLVATLPIGSPRRARGGRVPLPGAAAARVRGGRARNGGLARYPSRRGGDRRHRRASRRATPGPRRPWGRRAGTPPANGAAPLPSRSAFATSTATCSSWRRPPERGPRTRKSESSGTCSHGALRSRESTSSDSSWARSGSASAKRRSSTRSPPPMPVGRRRPGSGSRRRSTCRPTLGLSPRRWSTAGWMPSGRSGSRSADRSARCSPNGRRTLPRS